MLLTFSFHCSYSDIWDTQKWKKITLEQQLCIFMLNWREVSGRGGRWIYYKTGIIPSLPNNVTLTSDVINYFKRYQVLWVHDLENVQYVKWLYSWITAFDVSHYVMETGHLGGRYPLHIRPLNVEMADLNQWNFLQNSVSTVGSTVIKPEFLSLVAV